MNNKALIGIIAVVLIAAAAVGVYFIFFASGDYSLYSNAFKKTFDVDSMELSTSVKASIDGGATVTSTGTFKLKGTKATPQFINTMTMDGKNITQFCDGEYMYTDDGTNKNKIKLGASPDQQTPQPQDSQPGSQPQDSQPGSQPQDSQPGSQPQDSQPGSQPQDSQPGSQPQDPQSQQQNEEPSLDSYIEGFSGLIDAGKIKEMNSLEPIAEKYIESITAKDIDNGKQFDVVLLPEIVKELKSKLISENSNVENSPTVEVNTIKYSATIKDGYVSQIVFYFDLNVTASNDTVAKKVTVELTLKPVNPGQAVTFDLPSTAGF